jgi:hypothetical protein
MMKKGGVFTFRLVLASSLHVRLGMQTKNLGSSKAVDEHFYRPTDRTSLWQHPQIFVARANSSFLAVDPP